LAFSPQFRIPVCQKVTNFPRTDKSVPQYRAKLFSRQNKSKHIATGQENQAMKPKARFIKSVIEAARQNQTEMPWARGNRRASFVASDRAGAPKLRLKTA
jgi:hypothetical protein